jgi:hypothetical protein
MGIELAGVKGCGKSRPPTGFKPRTVQPVPRYPATGFQKYITKILLADRVTNLGREYTRIFKPTFGHGVCTETSNTDGVGAVSFAMYKIVTAQSTS